MPIKNSRKYKITVNTAWCTLHNYINYS